LGRSNVAWASRPCSNMAGTAMPHESRSGEFTHHRVRRPTDHVAT
jgi:hypothetical protein